MKSIFFCFWQFGLIGKSWQFCWQPRKALRGLNGVARFFLVQTYHKLYQITANYTKLPQTIPNYHKLYQITTNYTKLPQTIPNYHKLYQITTNYTKLPQTIYQITIKYTKWTYNIPNGHKINQHFPFQVSLKYTQIVKFGMKINHLATLGVNTTVNFSTIVEA
jgi:hypothetical protein